MNRKLLVLSAVLASAPVFAAERSNVGPTACADCHASELGVWEATPHAMSFKTVHKSEKTKDIIAAAGGDANIRKNATCLQCHFTQVAGDDGAMAAKFGPSCESCHGAASGWVKVHNAFGGPGGKKEGETAAQAAKRWGDAEKAGMLRPHKLYDLASNCNACHGLNRPGVSPETLGKMMDAGHPADAAFELVKFSQGNLRHRFGGKDKSINRERDAAELARLFAAGQAAKLVSAKAGIARGGPAVYQELQTKRLKEAMLALAALKSVPEAKALSDDPSEANARKLVDAVADKDFSAELGALLPAKSDYK